MAGTHLFYNGVLMRDCSLEEFVQSVEYDESGTDPVFNRYRITVESTLQRFDYSGLDLTHPSTIHAPTEEPGPIPDQVALISKLLSEPRRDFWFAINAVTSKPLSANKPSEYTPAADNSQSDSYRIVLAAAGLPDGYITAEDADGWSEWEESKLSGPTSTKVEIKKKDVVDLNNGPKPSNVSVVRIFGGQSMRIRFTIEVCRYACDAPEVSGLPPVHDARKVTGVLSNRWTVLETLNDKWETEVSIEGTIVVSDNRYKPAAMRTLVSPGLFPSARLVHRTFSTSMDGLKLKYRLTLRESGTAPPPGLVDWSGNYTERVANGAVCTGSMNIKLRGSHQVPEIKNLEGGAITSRRQYKQYMLEWLFLIIKMRLPVNTNFNPEPGTAVTQARLVDLAIIEDMKDPELSAQVTVMHTSTTFSDYSIRLKRFGLTIADVLSGIPIAADWQEDIWPLPPENPLRNFDDNNASVFDQYFQTPCSEWHSIPRGYALQVAEVSPAEESTTHTMTYTGAVSYSPTSLDDIPSPTDETFGWNEENQLSGFSYLRVELENHHKHETGVLSLPLSKARPSGDTMVAIPIHAGAQTRTVVMSATRQGNWPKLPAPKQVVSTGTGGLIDRLLKTEILPSAPQLAKDGKTWEYSVDVKWTYATNRPLREGDIIKVGSDPRDKTTPGLNGIEFNSSGSESGVFDYIEEIA